MVEKDEKENGLRKILNFGHTFAHAYEASLNFSRKLNHGEAVILGMITALNFSKSNKFLPLNEFNLIINHVKNFNLPHDIRKYFSLKDVNKIISFMINDKKNNTNKIISKKLTAFDFYGPTCDSMDYMKGPFLLPNNIKENDYIELGQLGAYGLTFRTQFNGFYSNEIYEVEDSPIMTLYDKNINKANLVA